MTTTLTLRMALEAPCLPEVDAVTRKVVVFLRSSGIGEEAFLRDLELAVTEGLTNAVKHGCVGAVSPVVELSVTITAREVVVEITDPSPFRGWAFPAQLPADPLQEGGRGGFLIEQLTDRCEHSQRAGRHVLELRKAFRNAWKHDPGAEARLLSAMMEEVGASYEMINALIGLGELLAGAGDVEAFMPLALERVCELTGAKAAYVRMHRSGGLVLEGRVGGLPAEVRPIVPVGGNGVEARVFATGEEVTLTQNAPGDDPLHGVVEAAFVAPILYKSSRRGVLVLAQNDAGASFFSAAQLKVARVVGEYLGIVSAINELQQRRESDQRALRELEIAAEIQMALMPQSFGFHPDLDIFGACEPALKAGGDYFDVIATADGGLLLVCADVMGKGVSAALLANMLRTNVRAVARRESDPGALLTEINANFAEDLRRLEIFITVVVAWVSPDRGTISSASAGHPAGILLRAGSPQILPAQELPVGIMADTKYRTHRVAFEPGDAFVMFTDGIPEAQNRENDFFGDDGVIRALEREQLTSAETLVRGVIAEVAQFSSHAVPSDDRTLLAVVRKQ